MRVEGASAVIIVCTVDLYNWRLRLPVPVSARIVDLSYFINRIIYEKLSNSMIDFMLI